MVFLFNGILLGYDKFVFCFFDADDYMMLTRIRDFFQHGTTSYSLLNRVNTPHGVDLYWSHVYDSVLISLTWIASFFTNSINKALEIIGFFIAPVIRLLTAFFLLKIFLKNSPKIAKTIVIFFLLHINLTEIFSLGRPDHHALIMMMEVLFLGQLQRVILNNTEKNKVLLGLIIAINIWTSVEVLPFILLCEVVLFFMGRNKFLPTDFFYINIIVAISISAILAYHSIYISFITIVLIILYRNWFKISLLNKYPIVFSGIQIIILSFCFYLMLSNDIIYDELSQTHLNLHILACIYFILINYKKKRYILLDCIIGGICAAVFLFFYPNFFLGIEGNASEFLRNFWFPTITDLVSILKLPHAIFNTIFWFESIVFFIAGYEKLKELNYHNLSSEQLFWLIFIVLGISYAVFSILACRMVMTWYLLIIPVIIDWLFKVNKKHYKLLSFLCILVPPTGYIIFSPQGRLISLENIQTVKLNNMNEIEFLKALNDISDKTEVIMSDPYMGPKILYYSKHNVVAVPFHRQHDGLISSLIVTQWSEYNEKLTINALLKTNSTYILSKSFANKNNLAGIIASGYAPQWISATMIDRSHRLKLVKIHKELIPQL